MNYHCISTLLRKPNGSNDETVQFTNKIIRNFLQCRVRFVAIEEAANGHKVDSVNNAYEFKNQTNFISLYLTPKLTQSPGYNDGQEDQAWTKHPQMECKNFTAV